MPNKKKIADLPKKAMNTKKTEAVKGGRKLNISARLRKPY